MKVDIRKHLRQIPWKLFLGILVFVLFAGAGAIYGVARWMERDLPPIEQVEAYRAAIKSSVYDADGKLLHEFFRENRANLRLTEIPDNLIQATITTEDKRFYSHWGVDLLGVSRAAITNVLKGGRVQGASTITQQLARNMFLTHERTFERKIKEALLALRIERLHSKHEILEMYFNQIYYGDGSYGVASASRNFFGKPPEELELHEAALLAGLPNSPGRYSPRRNPQAAEQRRNHVLKRMYEEKIISAADYRSAAAAPLGVTTSRFRANHAPYFIEMVRQYMDDKYGSNLLYEGGLRIYTTLELDLQETAEAALEKQITALEVRNRYEVTRENYAPPENDEDAPVNSAYLQGAVVCVDPHNGYLKALIGGRDFAQSPFNRAVQAQRQPGSAFKPFIYTAAIDNGFRPTDVIVDAPVSYTAGDGTEWAPRNYDQTWNGAVTLRYALQKSINIPAIKLLRRLGASQVASYARRMGIKSRIGPDLSLALGTSEVNLLEITSAYAVLANEGIRNEPLFILKVLDDEGNVLETNSPNPVDVLSPETASVVTNMMQSVVDHGTGYTARAMGLQAPAAGKTGTTDDYTDAWFVGFTPSLVCGVWVGFDVKRRMGRAMTGAVAALPAWAEIMIDWSEERPVENFSLPLGAVTREVCTETGLLATDACPHVTSEVFTMGTEPTIICNMHIGLPRQPGEPGEPGQPPARTIRFEGGDIPEPEGDFRTIDQRELEPETIDLR
jgi:penicillin-binding protein 1A